MFFRDENKRPVDQGHRQDRNKDDILRQGKLQREQRLLAKRQADASSFLQRRFRGMIVKKSLLKDLSDLSGIHQVPKNVNAILALISLKASDDTDGANKMKVMILQKALPKIFHKINVLLRLQNELKLVDGSFQENLVTLVEHFSSIGLTKFPDIRHEVQVLVERLLHSILVKKDMTMFDRLRKATVSSFSQPISD